MISLNQKVETLIEDVVVAGCVYELCDSDNRDFVSTLISLNKLNKWVCVPWN